MFALLVESPNTEPIQWQFFVTLGVAFLFFLLLDIFLFKLFIRAFPRAFLIVGEVAALAFYGFHFEFISTLFLFGLVVGVVAFYSANVADLRGLVGNNLKGKSTSKSLFIKRKRPKGEALFDREAMYQKIDTAVKNMSDVKMGAIITFEKNDNLDDIIQKSGTVLNAPITPELIQTIFYAGTRLHDGAVVIRNDLIVAASVYFTPSEQPLTGKYGSRHRAAIGISEICDAVTVVVSEETGRISLTYKGEMEHVTKENFLARFSELMAFNPDEPFGGQQ